MTQEKQDLYNKHENETERQQILDKQLEEAEQELHQLKVENDVAKVQREELEKKVYKTRKILFIYLYYK